MEKLLNNFKINFTKGDTYALAVKIKDITRDLSSAYFTVKDNPDDTPLIQKTLKAGISKIDDRTYKNEKTYKIQLQSEDTANLEPLVQYLYDFRVSVGNVVKTILSGVFVVNHSISEVSTTITSTLEVAIDDVVESEASTTSPTSGIEYEQDPVACAKIGDMDSLNTSAKGTLVESINSVKSEVDIAQNAIDNIIDGTTVVPKATNAVNAENATNATNATNAQNATNAVNTDFTNGVVYDSQYSASELNHVILPQRVGTYFIKTGNGDISFFIHDENDLESHLYNGSMNCYIENSAFIIVYYYAIITTKRALTVYRKKFQFVNGAFTQTGDTESLSFSAQRIR